MAEEIIEHKEGPPWTIAGRFATFEEANHKRSELEIEKNVQVKVSWMRKRDDFAVKTRVDPAVALLEEKARERDAKKRRKAKLNKKRRKK